MKIDGCEVTVTGGELSEEEIKAYIKRGREKYPQGLQSIGIRVDGEYVDLDYNIGSAPFHRIRRITGYLVGTLDRFNDGKRSEEKDRVKHSLT